MKKEMPSILTNGRLRDGPMASSDEYGFNGVFIVYGPKCQLTIIASTGDGWDHVSVRPTVIQRCLTWGEMCWVKDLFWDENETVMQLHPAKANHINLHEHVLHLWKPQNVEIPVPPKIMV